MCNMFKVEKKCFEICKVMKSCTCQSFYIFDWHVNEVLELCSLLRGKLGPRFSVERNSSFDAVTITNE